MPNEKVYFESIDFGDGIPRYPRDSAFMNNVNQNGCKNVLRVINKTTANYANIIYTPNSDGSISVSNTKASDIADYYLFAPDNKNENSIIPLGNDLERDVDYVLSTGILSNAGVRLIINLYDKDKAGLGVLFETQTHATFNLSTLDPNNLAAYYRVFLRVSSGATPVDNAVIYPMICLKSLYDLDSTYEPYAKTNQQLTKDTENITGLIDNEFENGCVNLLNNVASSTTTTDVTWVVNDDGTVTATVAEGVTTAAERIITIMSATDLETLLTKYDTLKIVGCPLGGSDTTGGYGIRCKQGSMYPRDNGYGLILKHSNGTITGPLVCQLKSGVVGSKTLTFKPMITLPTVSNSDYNHYVPYAKSNKELTDDVANITKQSGGLVSYGIENWVNNSATITLPRRGGLLVGGRNDKAFVIYVCENPDECAVLSGSDFVTATISGLTLSLTFTSHYGTTFNYKYINSLVGQV